MPVTHPTIDELRQGLQQWAELFDQDIGAVVDVLEAFADRQPSRWQYPDTLRGRLTYALQEVSVYDFPIGWVVEAWGRGGETRAQVEALVQAEGRARLG